MNQCNVPTFRRPFGNLFDSFFSDALTRPLSAAQGSATSLAEPDCDCGSSCDGTCCAPGCCGGPSPATDIAETAASFVIALDLPGIAEQDVHVEALDRHLTIRAERKDTRDTESTRWHRKEQRHGSFSRTIVLPDTADTSRIEAKLAQGVLTVTVQKLEKQQPKKIEVRG